MRQNKRDHRLANNIAVIGVSCRLYDSETQEALAFLMLHEPFDFNADIDGFVVPIDQAESFTGFDFLHLVPDVVEDVIEDRDTAATVRWPVP